jgi:hypothetical protein
MTMKSSKLLTTAVAALTVVGAGLVYAQTTQPTPTTPAPMEQPTQAQPMTPPSTTQTAPSQDTVQRSTTPMAPDAQADRN